MCTTFLVGLRNCKDLYSPGENGVFKKVEIRVMEYPSYANGVSLGEVLESF